MTLSPRTARLVLWILALGAIALVAVPVFLIRPFAPQEPASLDVAFLLRRWSPWLTLGALAGVVVAARRLWREPPGGLRRVGIALAVMAAAGAAWMARQNHFEWMFAPLPDARFVRSADADFIAPDDMVLAVSEGRDAAAYPVNQLAYHHLVEDAIDSVPIVATY